MSGAFLQACQGVPPPTTPIWLMRQAGRILPAYRALRAQHASIDALFNSAELAARITLMPITELGVDAAILFTDLVTPLGPMGAGFRYAPGPVFEQPVRSAAAIEGLRAIDPAVDLDFVLDAIRQVRRELPAERALIGYAGAPYTLAAWLAEGSSARDFVQIRRLMQAAPQQAAVLLDRVTDMAIDFLRAQVEAGVQAVQLFDTSVGQLPSDLFEQLVLPRLQRLFEALEPLRVPRIYFPLAAPHLLRSIGAIDTDILGLDWRVDLASAYRRNDLPGVLQGNLDPAVMLTSPDQITAAAHQVMRAAAGRAHIFNLGHGVLPETPVAHVRHLVQVVHAGLPRQG